MRTASTAFLIPAAVCLLAVSSSASAQSIEVGATIGNGQRGSESSIARTEARLVTGAQVGAWWADRVETAFRIVWLDLPADNGAATYYTGCEVDAAGTCRPTGSLRVIFERTSPRTFLTGQVLYHFRRGQQWRPFAGVGFGKLRDTEVRRCELAGCEQLMPGLQAALGRRTEWISEGLSPVAGVSTRIGEHLTVRGGIHFHRPFGEELSLFETFAGVGYRF